MPAGWPASLGCVQPDFVRHHALACTCSGRACNSLKPLSSSAHSISTGMPSRSSHLRSSRPSVDRLAGREAWLARLVGRHCLRRHLAVSLAVSAGVAVILAAGLDAAHEALAAEHDAVRHHLALGDRRAEPPGRAQQHVALGGLAQAAAGGARGDHRLDQHRHRGCRRIERVVGHVAPRLGGPQRRPAGPNGGEEIGFARDAEEALELAGEIGTGAVLDQRRGAHCARAEAALARGCATPPATARRSPARSAARRGRA